MAGIYWTDTFWWIHFGDTLYLFNKYGETFGNHTTNHKHRKIYMKHIGVVYRKMEQ